MEVREVGIDGYRCDVAGDLPIEFWNNVRRELDLIKPVFMLAEWEGRDLHAESFDMTYAFNPDAYWTREHQMSLSGKTDNFLKNDLIAFGEFAGLKTARARAILEEVGQAVSDWPVFAKAADVQVARIKTIQAVQRTELI